MWGYPYLGWGTRKRDGVPDRVDTVQDREDRVPDVDKY